MSSRGTVGLIVGLIVAGVLGGASTVLALGETMQFDVTTMSIGFQTKFVTSVVEERIQIADSGPGQTSQGGQYDPRWYTPYLGGNLFVWNDDTFGYIPALEVFGGGCGSIQMNWIGPPIRLRAEVSGGMAADFAWMPAHRPDGTVDQVGAFCLKWAKRTDTGYVEQVSIGRRVYVVPTTLKVFITAPKVATTVKGTAWVVMWVEGSSAGTNHFVLRVDGTQIADRFTTTKGPVSIPWSTVGLVNGAHEVKAFVVDGDGNSGTTTISVLVNN